MRKKLYILGLILVSLSASLHLSAQENKSIIGQIISKEKQKPLQNIVCKIFTGNNELLAYNITDKHGSFNFKREEKAEFIEFSSIGYKKQTKKFKDWLTHPIVKMEVEVINLNEVLIKVCPIKNKKDTLIYNIVAFKSKEDRYIDDVIKKLPGIDVSKTGKISYQGKPISKFYIEGQDLLGDRYNQATKSLPAEAVSQVEILENHQHIRALEDKEFPDRAALNIKLKSSYKMKPIGEIEAGLGGKSIIWDGNLFLAQIGAKSQSMLVGKMNNSGKDLSEFTSEHIDFSNSFAYQPLPSNVLPSSFMNSASISKERYLKNKSIYLGFNNLIKLSDVSNLRTNIMFYTDRRTESDSSYSYYGGLKAIALSQTNNKLNKISSFVPILKYEYNSPNYYILDEFKTVFSNTKQINTLSNNNKAVGENIRDKPTYFQNVLNITNNVGKQAYVIKSFIRYLDRKENLDLSRNELSGVDIKDGQVGLERFFTKNRISTILPFLGNSLDVGADFIYSKDNYTNSNLSFKSSNQNTENAVEKNTVKFGLSPEYTFRYSSNGRVTFGLTAFAEHYNLFLKKDEVVRSYLTCNPSFRLKHTLNNAFDFRFSGSYSSYDASSAYLSDKPIYHNYRTLYYSLNDIYRTKTYRLSTSVNYRDLAEMLFCRVSAIYSKKTKPFYYNYDYSNDITVAKAVLEDNTSNFLFLNGSVDKTFTSAGLSFKLSTSYSRNDYLMSQFGSKIMNTSNHITPTLSSNFTKLSWFKVFYSLTANLSWQDNDELNSSRRSMYNNLNFFFFINPKTDCSLTFEHSALELEEDKFDKNLFVDFKAHYSPFKRVEFTLRLNNLLDRKMYSVSSTTGPNYQSYYLPLRRREFLLSCKFKL
ncbi:MAG: hypothetical protein WBG43_00645 [Marinifilaceae bacterium]